MEMTTKTESEVRAIELLVISSKASTKKEGSGWKIRVVQWAKGTTSVSVKLECGEYWRDEEGRERFKAKGFAKRDLDACKPKWPEIMALMTTPPAIAAPEGSVPAADPNDPGF